MSQCDGPTALDLFCGAGGFTLGLQRAGYDVIAGVDYNEQAVQTYDENFDHPAYQYNLAEVNPLQFDLETGIQKDNVQCLAGGPPCQGFSRSNLQRDSDDPRNNLVFRFARYVDYYQPKQFVMENVKGIQTIDDGETIRLLCEDFRGAGYRVKNRVLHAADFGVPQKRERMFFIGLRDDIDGEPQFPERTHAPRDEIQQPTTQAVTADD